MILRTYLCEACGHTLEVQLSSDQWNAEPPDCDYCPATPMAQEFKPPAIGGSHAGKALARAHRALQGRFRRDPGLDLGDRRERVGAGRGIGARNPDQVRIGSRRAPRRVEIGRAERLNRRFEKTQLSSLLDR